MKKEKGNYKQMTTTQIAKNNIKDNNNKNIKYGTNKFYLDLVESAEMEVSCSGNELWRNLLNPSVAIG